jgi:hypothetical protein
VLNDPALYRSILSGAGSYKVIGKPGSKDQVKAESEDDDSEE